MVAECGSEQGRVYTCTPVWQVGRMKVTVVTCQSPKAGMASQELLGVPCSPESPER